MKNKIIIASVLASTALALLAWAVSAVPQTDHAQSSVPAPPRSQGLWGAPGSLAKAREPAHVPHTGTPDSIASEPGLDVPAIPEPGVRYGRLADQPLPEALKYKLRAELQRLRDTGSGSGGKVTHEFASVDDAAKQLREWGLGPMVSALAITPTQLSSALGEGFALIGADTSGKEIPGRGRAAFYQVWRSGTNQWVELAEDQLDVLGGDGSVVNVDFHNQRVANYPATLESLQDKDGSPLHNLQWWVKDRSFFLTARNMSKDEVIALAGRISHQMEALAHDGWRTAYDFDPENPAHRRVRSRQHALAQATANPR